VTVTSPAQQLSILRTKLVNLADDIEHRVMVIPHYRYFVTSDDTTSLETLLEKLLDRLFDFAESVTNELICVRCPNPAIYEVEAGQPDTIDYRDEIVCAACLRVSKQWAGVKGPVRTRLLTSDERRFDP
jgi:hypothetical protein